LLRQATRDLRVAAPGIIQSFDPIKQTAVVQIALREKVVTPGKPPVDTTISVLKDVPVVTPHGGGWWITMPLRAGDECLLVFADMCIDYWWLRGGVQNQFEVRRHDISDAFCIPGPWSQPEVIPAYNPTNMQLRSYAGDIVIDLSTVGVTVTAPEVSVIASGTAAVAAPIVAITSPAVDVITASASVKAVGGTAQPLVNAAWLTWFTNNIIPFLASKGYTGPAMPAISTTTVLEAE
jgi:hypothetical protein